MQKKEEKDLEKDLEMNMRKERKGRKGIEEEEYGHGKTKKERGGGE